MNIAKRHHIPLPRWGWGALSPARQVAMYLCQRIGDMRLSEIARIFKLSSYGSAGR